MDWAKVERGRERLVLFPTRLDEAIGPQHRVRLFDEILSRLDWSTWETEYDLRDCLEIKSRFCQTGISPVSQRITSLSGSWIATSR